MINTFNFKTYIPLAYSFIDIYFTRMFEKIGVIFHKEPPVMTQNKQGIKVGPKVISN